MAANPPPSRLELAFLSAWNLAALGALGVLAAVTKSPAPLLAGVALEAGWLAFATRPRASRLLFARRHEQLAEAETNARRAALVATLSEADADRVRRLHERRADILRQGSEHRHLAREVLLAELSRLSDIVDAFVELAAGCRRQEAYHSSIDVADLESELRRFEEDAERAADETQRVLARRNLEVLLRRREQVDELRRNIQRTRSQLDLIESTFRMIANEIMLMRSTDGLRGQLDDLVVGVQAVREISGDADEPDGRTAAARAQAALAAQAQTTTTRRG